MQRPQACPKIRTDCPDAQDPRMADVAARRGRRTDSHRSPGDRGQSAVAAGDRGMGSRVSSRATMAAKNVEPQVRHGRPREGDRPTRSVAAKNKAAAEAAAKKQAAADAAAEKKKATAEAAARRRRRPPRPPSAPGQAASRSTKRVVSKLRAGDEGRPAQGASPQCHQAGRRMAVRRTTWTAGSARRSPAWRRTASRARTRACTGTSCASPRGNPKAINLLGLERRQRACRRRACSR